LYFIIIIHFIINGDIQAFYNTSAKSTRNPTNTIEPQFTVTLTIQSP